MKSLKIIFILFGLFFSIKSFSQNAEFKCDMDEYQGRHGDNKQWNDLIDNACKEIKKHNYEMAIELLTEATKIDQDAYINGQLGMLKKFVEKNHNSMSEDLNEEKEKSDQEEKNSAEAKAMEMQKADSIEKVKAEELAKQEEEQKRIDQERAIQDSIEKANADSLLASSNEIPKEKENSEFSEAMLEDFHLKGKQKVRDLEGFIISIANKSTSSSVAMQAIENAIILFDSEERTVQVSSINKTVKPKYKIRTYFQRLRNLNYDNVSIEWAEFQYASDFKKARDGTWRGSITFTQRFTSTRDNQISYTDETTKKIEVVLKYYGKEYQGETIDNWDVLLGDISVVQTDKY